MNKVEEILNSIREVQSPEEVQAVVKAIEKRREELNFIALDDFIKQGKALVKQYSVDSIEDLLALHKARNKRSRNTPLVHPPKYANPDDPTDTYTGYGRQPKFIKIYLSAHPNNKLEDLLINK